MFIVRQVFQRGHKSRLSVASGKALANVLRHNGGAMRRLNNVIRVRHFSQVAVQLNEKKLDGFNEELSRSTDFMHIQNILLQKNQERMTKRKLLSEASGFYERFKINTKWFLIRGNRPFSADELGTMISWLLLSQILWVILGTTTFVSLLLLIANTVFAKEMVGNFVGKTLNLFLDGIDVTFQDALVPEWKKGCIRFNNVEIKTPDSNFFEEYRDQVEFNLKFHQIEMTLSVKKWLFGNGLIENVTVYGMRGDLTMRTDSHRTTNKIIDWFNNPHYELKEFKMVDSQFILHDTIMKNNFKIAIYNLHMPQLRFEWAINDFLNASVVDGSINNTLFNIHKRQHRVAYINDLENDLSDDWKRITRLRVDSLNVRDIGLPLTSSFNWIDDGEVEVIADIMLPKEEQEQSDFVANRRVNEDSTNKYVVLDLKFKFKDLKAKFPKKAPCLSTGEPIVSLEEMKPIISYVNSKSAFYNRYMHSNPNNDDSFIWKANNIAINKTKSFPLTTIFQTWQREDDDDTKNSALQKQIIKFHDDISTVNNEIVLSCRVVKNLYSLKNMVTFEETGIYDALSMELYVDLMKMVEEWEYKRKNDWMKVWGSTFASQLIVVGIGAMV